ncbi:protein DOG1-like 4 [Vigna unguiculata]|nr:protein DOG1-like 4 [Vigna unguiculata]
MTLFLPLIFPSKYHHSNASALSKPITSHNQLQEPHFNKNHVKAHVLSTSTTTNANYIYSPLSSLSLYHSPLNTKMADVNAASFEAFLQGWMVRQNDFLGELLSAHQQYQEGRRVDVRPLIDRVICHYGQYFEEKSKIAHHDIFLIFSPPWFSSLEQSFLWVGGFKPGVAFQIVNTALGDLTQDQKEKLSQLKQETKMKERTFNDDLAKLQESVGDPPLVEMARNQGRLCINGSPVTDQGSVPNTFKEKLENLVANADALRTDTALKILKILRPGQIVKFMASAAELQIKVRSWGSDKDAQNGDEE